MKIKQLHAWDLDFEGGPRGPEAVEPTGLVGAPLARPGPLCCRVRRRGEQETRPPGGRRGRHVVSGPGSRGDPNRRRASFFPLTYPATCHFENSPFWHDAWKTVRTPFQVMLCDGQGIAHPRGFGLAAHAGLVLGVPTVGCAKSRPGRRVRRGRAATRRLCAPRPRGQTSRERAPHPRRRQAVVCVPRAPHRPSRGPAVSCSRASHDTACRSRHGWHTSRPAVTNGDGRNGMNRDE